MESDDSMAANAVFLSFDLSGAMSSSGSTGKLVSDIAIYGYARESVMHILCVC